MQGKAANLDFAKNFVKEQILRQALGYLEKDSEVNLPKIFNLAKLLAIKKEHKEQVEQLALAYRQNPAIRTFVNRLFVATHPNVKHCLVYNWFINAMLFGISKQAQMSQKHGVNVPNFFLVDPTGACNLACEGCWAGKYAKKDSLSYERLDQLFTEAKELGIYWAVMSGGEPFAYPRLFELAGKHSDMAFMAYTNGTLIDEEAADKIVEVGNLSPAISLEGWRERTDARRGAGAFDKVIKAMDLLKEKGAILGVSITVTRDNVMEVTSDDFIDFLVDKGVAYGWLFHYIPIGRDPDPGLMVTAEQRAYLAGRIPYIRANKPILLADFWNDGEMTGGCIAGGRRYFHINAAGDVEPCAFVHFAVDNINEKTLLEVLRSSLFASFQKRQPFCKNHLRPCPIIDNPDALRAIVAESGALPTHPGAETILDGPVAESLDQKAARWGVVADGIQEERRGGRQAQYACRKCE
ncbi:MAG: pyrroloquinoline quinone biosynthesis protein PqqE [Pelotomaculum sp. PtaB.Bin013]|uniref:Radical SAM protein n=1 Tax=Pelotomaculum isophthalicicum JI TaxID=947010 RepID=A0A9X4H2K9_9FIRM|nr:radical SAM protein [Pelotomaculum isophthalicicum]MDF9408991.1 radical SAM protein [Pelotomaculum isophthalicicum JI]OPX91784.1 MAG: pyrroloquinoline quinone biosynthesis protein PqqE [Pelotomaculum sp. PtaB.Bin013]